MRPELRVDEAQLKAALAEFDAIRARGADPRAAFDEPIRDWLDQEKDAFATHGSSLGARWEPIGSRSARMRSVTRISKKGRRNTKVYRNPHPLQLTRGLYRSLTQPRARWAIRRRTRTGFVVGTRKPDAHLHNLGNRHEVQRQLVNFRPSDADRWLGQIGDWLFDDNGLSRKRGLL